MTSKIIIINVGQNENKLIKSQGSHIMISKCRLTGLTEGTASMTAKFLFVAFVIMAFATNLRAQDVTVNGVVTNSSTGDPLVGVNIKVRGTSLGTFTNQQGKYTLEVPSLTDTLVFTFIGFESKIVPIKGRETINVALKSNTIQAQELVVIGYGQQQQEDLTSSVSQVSAEDLTSSTPVNLGQALQGTVAGAQVIQQGGGVPGGKPIIHIRGINSINTSTTPLYVVDGIVGVPNALTTINPYAIKSISVLKGPSATAIYGARGANGVVVITTKDGMSGETRVTYNGSVSVGVMQRHLFAATPKQLMYIYVQAMNNSAKFDGSYGDHINRNKDYRACCNTGMSFSEIPWLFKQVEKGSYLIPLKGDDGNYYKPRFWSNWEDIMFNPSVSTNQHIMVQGGGENMNYSFGLGYTNNQGLLNKSWLKKYNGRATMSVKIFDWLDLDTQISYNKSKKTDDTGIMRPKTEVWSFLPTRYPNKPDIYGRYAGRWGTNADFPIGEQWYNPVFLRHQEVGRTILNTTRGSLSLTAAITDHLEFKTNFSAIRTTERYHGYDGKLYGQPGAADIETWSDFTWQSQNYFTYENTFGQDHNVSAMLGFSWSLHSWRNLNLGNSVFFNNFYKWHQIGVGSSSSPELLSEDGESALNSYFLRIHYSYQNKYMLTVTGRYDGSSKFGVNKKYGFFPSVGVAWNISQENFMDDVDFISNLKLRGEVGRTGNQAIGSYVTQAFIGASSDIILGDETVTGLYPTTLGNPNLHWEETVQYDVGVDVGLFKNRIKFSVDYYYKKTTGMLLYIPTPEATTSGSVIQNFGAMENKGWEISLNTRNIVTNDFTWSTTITASTNENTILELGPNGAPIYTNLSQGYPGSVLKVGESVGSYFTLIRKGVWGTDQVAEAARYGLKPGDLHYADLNNDGQISLPADGTITGNAFPEWTINVTNSFNYKNFDLSFLIRIVTGLNKYFVHESAENRQLVSGGLNTVLNAWRPDHQNTMIAQMRGGNQGAYYQALNDSHDVYDGDYIMGSQATLGYTLSGDWTNRIGIRNLRIYLKANKFFVLTEAYGYNVEGSSLGQINPLVPNLSKYQYPRPSVYSFGVNIQF